MSPPPASGDLQVFPFRRYGSFSVTALSLVTLTFDLSTSKWGLGSPMPRASFHPLNFQLATPFRCRLRVRHVIDRQTDRQTYNSHQCITRPSYGCGIWSVRTHVIMDARSASVHVIFYRCFLCFFFMTALVGQTAERIFTKLSHVIYIRC